MLMYTGRTFAPEDALRLGIIDEVTDDLPARAEAMARHLANLPPRAFALAKRQLRDKTIDRAKHYANEADPEIMELWASDETHARVREYLAKTVKR